MSHWNVFWGELHDNTYQVPNPTPSLDESCRIAASHLDFYGMAYYTACAEAFQPGGHPSELSNRQKLILEGWKSEDRLRTEWAEVQEAVRSHCRPGAFVTFPGYEWQGDGRWGDHNVFYLNEGPPVFRVNTLRELQSRLLPLKAIAVPHHTGYRVGRRAPDWSLCDERITPFTEIYSLHGCSETDEEWIGLRQNSHMGPGAGGGTYQDALDLGLHLGAICSTDNWGRMPGHYGRGLAACLASELTREGLWEAFLARRVYGVTGDRIRLGFTLNDHPMGSRISCSGKRAVHVSVRGLDALDRVEILRGRRVLATHCHQGTWDCPPEGRSSRFKLRIEVGWGPRPNELQLPDRDWEGELRLSSGRFLGFEPCWVSPGQQAPILAGSTVRFAMRSAIRTVQDPRQNSNVFEFEATPETEVLLRLNGLEERTTVRSLCQRSRILWYRDECVRMLQEHCGLGPGSPEREDVYYHTAYKAKLHRAVPEAGYAAELDFEDDEPFEGEIHYRVRVEQRNGQRAWSSPVWVRHDPEAGGTGRLEGR